jgi:uncharacterized protein (DUF885 family)
MSSTDDPGRLSGMTEEFAPLADRIVDALLAANPSVATFAGDHRFDDRLDDFSADGVSERVTMLREASDTLDAADIDELEIAEQVDHAILQARVDQELFELTEVREHEWNPLVHNPGALLEALIDRPTGPAEVRLANLAARLAFVPDALATARAALRHVPQIHLETGAGQFAGTAALVRDGVPRLLAEAPALGGDVKPVADQAIAALDEFSGWLRERAAQDVDRPSPRLGRRLWEARLWHTLDTELTAGQVLESAQQRLGELGAQMRETAVAMVGGPLDDDTVRRALAECAERRPDNSTIVGRAVDSLADTTEFVRQFELVSLVDDPCVVKEMPEYARGVAVAYCDPPGPLETAHVPTLYCISPTPGDWSAERVESFYREYNDDLVRDLTIHEAMPGHYLQLAHSRRYRGTSKVRALGFSGPFVEGWACYAEEVMIDAGYGGLPLKLQQLKTALRSTLNAILDQAVHCDDMSEAEAMAMMQHRGLQEEGEAAGKWRRALLTSTQLSTYFVGYSEVGAIGRARPDGVALREWHDRMLAYGSPPPRHLRTLLSLAPAA